VSITTAVQVIVTKSTALPTRAGFGTVLIAAYHTVVGSVVRTFSSLALAEAAGFTAAAYPAIHRALTVAFLQNPRPPTVKIGKRTLPPTQVVAIGPRAAQGTGYVWSYVIDGVTISYTEQAADTVTLISDGLRAAVTAAALDITPSGTTTVIHTADNAGEIHSFKADPVLYTIAETTTDPGIATDLSAIQAADEDWYGLALDSQSPLELAAAAAWCETRTKDLAGDAYTTDVIDSGSSTDIGSVLQTALRDRSWTYWTDGRISAYYALGRMAGHFAAYDPGTATWAYKATRGVENYDILTPVQDVLESKNVNYTANFGGVYVMLTGTMASGEWIDVTRTIDWTVARVREDVINLLIANPKLPYDDPSLATVQGAIRQRLEGGVPTIFSAEPAPFVSVPAVADIDAADRTARLLPDVEFFAQIAGAIHTVQINGLLQI